MINHKQAILREIFMKRLNYDPSITTWNQSINIRAEDLNAFAPMPRRGIPHNDRPPHR